MKQIFIAIFIAVLAAAERPSDSTPPEKYEVLSGDGFNGSGFIVRHDGAFWGVCSLHQFGGKAAECLLTLEADRIELDRSHARNQKDVQILPVVKPASDLPFLRYESDFRLSGGDELLILGPAGGVIEARLTNRQLRGDTYDSALGPVTLELQAAKPFIAAGGSGGPILLKKSGAVIGVLLTADDPNKARIVGFETLCLGDAAKAIALHKQRLQDALEPLVADLPKGAGWQPAACDIPRENIRLAYSMLLGSQAKGALKATRHTVGYAGQGGGSKEESVQLVVTEFTDAAVAMIIPAELAAGYQRTMPYLKATGISFDDVRVTTVPAIHADATSLVRARGRRGKDAEMQPFTNTIARAARGCFVVELVLQNLDMTDEELTRIVAAALDRVGAVTPMPAPAATAPVAASQPTSSPGADAPK